MFWEDAFMSNEIAFIFEEFVVLEEFRPELAVPSGGGEDVLGESVYS